MNLKLKHVIKVETGSWSVKGEALSAPGRKRQSRKEIKSTVLDRFTAWEVSLPRAESTRLRVWKRTQHSLGSSLFGCCFVNFGVSILTYSSHNCLVSDSHIVAGSKPTSRAMYDAIEAHSCVDSQLIIQLLSKSRRVFINTCALAEKLDNRSSVCGTWITEIQLEVTEVWLLTK